MSILYGFYEADAGEILVNGKPVRIRSSREAISHGIGMVHPAFHAGAAAQRAGKRHARRRGRAAAAEGAGAIRKQLAELGREYGLEVDPDAIVGELSVGLQQRVEILKALVRGAEILVLDEPTAVLTPPEADQLFEMLRVLKVENKTIILITHKLREIMALTDRVSVMRRGEMVATFETAKTSPPELADAMVGRKVILRIDKGPAHPGAVALEAQDLVVRDDRGVVAARRRLVRAAGRRNSRRRRGRRQRPVGAAGGAGRHPAAGARRDPHRRRAAAAAERNPRAVRQLGVGHVPEDRHRVGLIMPFEACESAMLGFQREPVYGEGLLFDRRRDRRRRGGARWRLRRPPARRRC